ncbi:hypothetical protein [Sphingomonas montanisoli]|uniref:Transmembrane protein n=1 Tax=Sphingomonas montanisoli TaxID=2606412 RepID=A0A5D9CB64_9SPHN|nr:hypothetical protein [Sphingomonas montanisoli]TZG28974.1 hypothetical protein FYJ91_02185 [Sphingomonas montanisoli]
MNRPALARIRRPILGALGIGFAMGLLAFALLCLANRMSLGHDDTARIRAAFASGDLQDRDWLPGNTDIGHHQFNDCLTLLQAIDQRGTTAQLTVSPIIWTDMPGGMCAKLHAFAERGGPTPPVAFYNRYLHGHTTLTRYLLPDHSVADIRELYKKTEIRLLVLGISIAMLTVALRRRRAASGLVWFAAFIAFARFFGIEAFGQSLSHGPADIVFVGAILALALANLAGGARLWLLLAGAALFGALTIDFEFLSGGLPLGTALVIGGTALALRAKAKTSPVMAAASATIAFWAAVLTTIAIKLALVASTFGTGALAQIARSTEVRMAIIPTTGEPVDASFGRFVSELFWNLDALAPGAWPLPVLAMALGVAGGLWALFVLRPHPDVRVRQTAWLLAGSNLALLVWVVATRQHIVLHAWFMDRIFVWTIASGFGLFAYGAMKRRST